MAGTDTLSFDPGPAVLKMRVGKIVEWMIAAVLHGLTPERYEAPSLTLPVQPHRIVRLAHVRTSRTETNR